MTVMSMGVVCVCSRETREKTERDGGRGRSLKLGVWDADVFSEIHNAYS